MVHVHDIALMASQESPVFEPQLYVVELVVYLVPFFVQRVYYYRRVLALQINYVCIPYVVYPALDVYGKALFVCLYFFYIFVQKRPELFMIQWLEKIPESEYIIAFERKFR